MGKKVSLYTEALKILAWLKTTYPNLALGQHLSSALQEYGDLWNVTDKEFLFALEKYRTEIEFNVVSEEEVDKIVRDAENLDKLFTEEEEDYE